MTASIPSLLQPLKDRLTAARNSTVIADQAKLIAAVESVAALADAWQGRGEHLKSFAKASPEDVQDSLNDQADDLLWHANLVRAALTQALGGDEK